MSRGRDVHGTPGWRCLAVTSLFPNAVQPTHGVFVRQRLQALTRHGAAVRVLAPVPYVPPGPVPARYAELRSIARTDEIGGIPVRYPRYPMIPKISMNAQAWSYARGITGAVRQAVRTWQPHLLDAHYLYPDACAAARVASRFGLPYVCSARGSDVKLLAHFPRVRKQIRAALEGAAAVIAVSNDLADEMRSLGLTDGPIHVIPNGVDPTLFHPRTRADARRELGLPEHKRFVVCVAHFVGEHGHALLVRGLAHEDAPRDLELFLIGGGAERARVQALVQSLGLEKRVHLLGPVEHQRVPAWYCAADASALISDREGCPNVVLESLACGTPCLGSDLPEMREVIVSPRQGTLVPRTPAGVARGLTEIVAGSWPVEDLTAEPRTWDAVARRVMSCFEQAVARPEVVPALGPSDREFHV
jgi:glycosyltransferase involved in cell wall biosynthesis